MTEANPDWQGRLEKLERSNARLRAAIAAIGSLALLGAALKPPEAAERYVSRAFGLIDSEERNRAVLAPAGDGGVQLAFLDATGTRRLAAGLLADGGPFLLFSDAEGKDRLRVGAEPSGEMAIRFVEGGANRLIVRSAADTAGIRVVAPGGEGVSIEAGPTGSGLAAIDSAGGARVFSGLTAEGRPTVAVLDAEGVPRAGVEIDETGTPVVSTRREDGAPAVAITSGGVFVTDEDGMPRAALGVGKDGPKLELLDADGQAVFSKP